MTNKILRVDLKNDYKERFEKIKDGNSHVSDAAVVRSLIDQFEPGKSQIEIDIDYLNKIRGELDNPMMKSLLKTRYRVRNEKDFIEESIRNFLKKINEERGDLMSNLREYSETQRSIAHAIFQLQLKGKSEGETGISKSDILAFLEMENIKIDEKIFDEDLSYFIKSGFILKRGNLYYEIDQKIQTEEI